VVWKELLQNVMLVVSDPFKKTFLGYSNDVHCQSVHPSVCYTRTSPKLSETVTVPTEHEYETGVVVSS